MFLKIARIFVYTFGLDSFMLNLGITWIFTFNHAWLDSSLISLSLNRTSVVPKIPSSLWRQTTGERAQVKGESQDARLDAMPRIICILWDCEMQKQQQEMSINFHGVLTSTQV